MDEIFNELAFTLTYPGGSEVKIYPSGKVEGVPPGTLIFNRIPILFAMLANKHRQNSDAPSA